MQVLTVALLLNGTMFNTLACSTDLPLDELDPVCALAMCCAGSEKEVTRICAAAETTLDPIEDEVVWDTLLGSLPDYPLALQYLTEAGFEIRYWINTL